VLPYRSWLFVPGHKDSWVDKALAARAHALILDLEDAVAERDKDLARELTSRSITRLEGSSSTGVIVRVNGLDTLHFGADLEAVVRPGLTALLLPKVYDVDDVKAFDALVRHFEIKAGMDVGTVGLVPSLETAKSLVNVESICGGPRVVSVMAAAARDADISREVGFHWTPGGLETLYLRSRAVMAARAAGIRNIVVGLWQDLHDLTGLRQFAENNRDIGFTGQVVIHPSHVQVVNDAYALSESELARYRGIVEAYDRGVVDGHGAVLFDGEHIDLAHAQNARQIIEFNRLAPGSSFREATL